MYLPTTTIITCTHHPPILYPGLSSAQVQAAAVANGVNVRVVDDAHVGVSFGEAVTRTDVQMLLKAFGVSGKALDNIPHSPK